MHCRDSPKKEEQKSCKKNGCPDPGQHKHDSDAKLPEGKEVFVFRDTRAVMVSQFYWARHDHKNLAQFARDPIYGISRTIKEQNLFWKYFESTTHWKTALFYEDLAAEPIAGATRIVSFLHMKLNQSQVQLAVNASSFDSMRKKETEGLLRLKVHPDSQKKLIEASKNGWNASKLFGVMTRKGEAEGWMDELDDKTYLYVVEQMRKDLVKALQKRFFVFRYDDPPDSKTSTSSAKHAAAKKKSTSNDAHQKHLQRTQPVHKEKSSSNGPRRSFPQPGILPSRESPTAQ